MRTAALSLLVVSAACVAACDYTDPPPPLDCSACVVPSPTGYQPPSPVDAATADGAVDAGDDASDATTDAANDAEPDAPSDAASGG